MIPLVAPTITKHDRTYLRHRINYDLLENETEVARFEEAFAQTVHCAGAIAVNSGTSALQLALHGRAAFIPSYTCIALRNAANTIVHIDSHYHVPTATLTLERPQQWHLPLVVPHAFGQPTRYQHGQSHTVIEDVTLSLGNVQLSAGAVGVCSTHWSKMISTGRGGVIFGDNLELLAELRRRACYETTSERAQSLAMSSTQAALGVSQLKQLPAFIERRRELAHTYSQRFTTAGIECPDPDNGSVFFRYLIAVDQPATKVVELENRGIQAGRGVNPPLHQLAQLPDTRFPGATQAFNTLLSVPCHPSISDRQARQIAEHVVEVCAP